METDIFLKNIEKKINWITYELMNMMDQRRNLKKD